MGVDAEIYFKTEQYLSEQELKNISYRLGDAFHPETFWDGPLFIDEREDMYHIKYMSRYYGPGYERGNLPQIISICKFIKDLIPNCTVYYGSDSGESFNEFTEEFEKELWNHFVKNGRNPYLKGWGGTKICTDCGGQMWCSGSSKGKEMFSCSGCGYSDWEKEKD